MNEKIISGILLLLILAAVGAFFITPDFFVSANSLSNEKKVLSDSDLNTVVTPTSKQAAVPRATLVSGFDWSLPASTTAEPYSGFVDEGYAKLPTGLVRNRFVMLRWDNLNPSQGQFDFSSLDNALKEAGDKNLVIRLEVNSACEAPAWALKKLRSSRKKSLIFWDKQYHELLSPLIRHLAKRYAANPRIAGVQLGIGDGEYKGSCSEFSNKDGWGEFWMSPDELEEAEDRFGLTPNILYKTTRQLIDLYADAFGPYRGKLAFTNSDPYFSWGERSPKYDRFMPKIAAYALARGLGNRDGEVKVWMRYLYPSYGVSFRQYPDHRCSLKMDEQFAEKIKGRYWGTENEFYGLEDYILDYGGPQSNQPYRFMISSLRALQMRRNFMMIHAPGMKNLTHPVFKTQDFMEYLTKTMGKQIENTPDAFVLLGERYIRADRVKGYSRSGEACIKDNKLTVRSFGRWLSENKQTEPGAPAMRVTMPKSEKNWAQGAYLPEGIDYEYLARSATKLSFDLSQELLGKRCQPTCDAIIKATFKDAEATTLSLNVAEGQSIPLKTHGDGKIKTAGFRITSGFSKNKQGAGFSLSTAGKPLPFIMIRVIFLQK